MPTGLKRFQDDGDCHFITFSCHGRKLYLTEPGAYKAFQPLSKRQGSATASASTVTS